MKKTFPNSRVDTCRESSTQKNTGSREEVVKKPRDIVTRRQRGVMRPKGKTLLRKSRQCVTALCSLPPCRYPAKIYPHPGITLVSQSTGQTCSSVCLADVYLCYCSLPYRSHSCHWFRNPGPANPPARLCHRAAGLVSEVICMQR